MSDGKALTTERKPDVLIKVHLVEYGYEIDVYNSIDDTDPERWMYRSETRDFGGSYNIEEMREEIAERALQMMQDYGRDKDREGK